MPGPDGSVLTSGPPSVGDPEVVQLSAFAPAWIHVVRVPMSADDNRGLGGGGIGLVSAPTRAMTAWPTVREPSRAFLAKSAAWMRCIDMGAPKAGVAPWH